MLRMRGVPLLAADAEFARLLRPQERAQAEHVNLPLGDFPRGPLELSEQIDSPGAFAVILLDGMVLQTIRLAGHVGLRLLGPGDLLTLDGPAESMVLAGTSLRATVRTRAAILGNEFLLATRHWPRLLIGLHARAAEQQERLLAQLMICQLPRVDDRLLAMLWLIAESRGRVTSVGTIVPVKLTHGVLGGLVGARRSTVTLALKKLTERGALIRQADGWLLLEPPAGASTQGRDRVISDPSPLEPVRARNGVAHVDLALTALAQ